MQTTNIPGFTAERSLTPSRTRYRSAAGLGAPGAGGVIPAADNKPTVEAFIDCQAFPENITCRECGNTGEDSLDCCQLQGMQNPGDSCLVLNAPQTMVLPPPKTSRFPRYLTNRGRILG